MTDQFLYISLICIFRTLTVETQKIQSVALINYSKCFVALMKELEKKKCMIETKNSYMNTYKICIRLLCEVKPSCEYNSSRESEYKLEYLI